MPLDSGNVTIAPDGTATGDGLAKLIYDALADQHDAFPGQLPPPGSPGSPTPGAQESLARLARAIAEPIAIAVNEGVEVTADPGEVLGNPIDSGSPLVAHPLTPAQLNAIVGSALLQLLQGLVIAAGQHLRFGSTPTAASGQVRATGAFECRSTGALTARCDSGSLALTATAGALTLSAGAGAAVLQATGGNASLLAHSPGTACVMASAGSVSITSVTGTTIQTSAGSTTIQSAGGAVALIANSGGASATLQSTTGPAAIVASTGVDITPGTDQPVRIASGLIRLIERAAGITLSAGQALYFAKSDTPCNPYFRDDTNVDRKIATAPVPLTDMATIAEATILLRALGTGAGTPVAGTAAQLIAILLSGGFAPAQSVPGGDGTDGRDGVDGQPGRQGLAGSSGAAGQPGRDGSDGADGSDGVPGPGLPVYLLSAGEVMGNAADSGSAAAPRPLSGAQVAELIRRSTTLALTPAPGDLTITVNANTTIVTVTTTGDVRVQGIIGMSEGREVTIEHIRASGSGELRLQHQSGIGGGAADFLLPNGIDLFVGNRVGIDVRLRASFLRINANSAGAQLVLSERATGQTLLAGQGQFYPKSDTPCNPYFRDDTNVDRKIVTAPVPLSDMATIGQGTQLGRTILGGTGVPVALTGLQQGQNLRRGTYYVDSTTTGTVATFALAEDATQIVFTGSGTIQLEGATILNGKDINWTVDVNATVVVTFMHDGAPTITQERFRTHTQRQITIRAGESITTSYFLNRHRVVGVGKRIDPQLTSVVRDDFDGQVDAAGVLARSPWIAWDAPTIAQVDTAASGFHSSNHPGILHMQSDAALADECCIYRGPFDFASIATFGATIMIPTDGGNELLNCAMGFGIVADPTDMDLTTGGGIWTDNNLVILHRSAGAGAGNWLIRRENAGAGASGSSGVAVVAGTWATFRLEQTTPGSGSWRCYVNGTLFTTATLANTSGIAYLAIGMIRGAGAAGRNLLVDEVFIDTFELNRAAA